MISVVAIVEEEVVVVTREGEVKDGERMSLCS